MESIGGSVQELMQAKGLEMLPGQKRRHAVNFMYVSIERKRK